MDTKHVLTVCLILVVSVLLLINPSVTFANKKLSTGNQDIYSDWNSTNDWLIIQATADSVGDSYIYVPNTEMVRRAITFSLSYDNYRESWGTVFIPDSRNHVIVSKSYTGHHSNPSAIRYSDVQPYDNSKNASLSPLMQYSLDTLWSFANSVIRLPLPSPWGLILNTPPTTVNYMSNLEGVTITYNNNPALQGCDYLIYINKNYGSVPPGDYWINIETKADAGLLVSNSYSVNKKNNITSKQNTDNLQDIVLPDTVIDKEMVSNRHGTYERKVLKHMPIVKYLKTLQKKHSVIASSTTLGTSWIDEGNIDIRLIGDFRIKGKHE